MGAAAVVQGLGLAIDLIGLGMDTYGFIGGFIDDPAHADPDFAAMDAKLDSLVAGQAQILTELNALTDYSKWTTSQAMLQTAISNIDYAFSNMQIVESQIKAMAGANPAQRKARAAKMMKWANGVLAFGGVDKDMDIINDVLMDNLHFGLKGLESFAKTIPTTQAAQSQAQQVANELLQLIATQSKGAAVLANANFATLKNADVQAGTQHKNSFYKTTVQTIMDAYGGTTSPYSQRITDQITHNEPIISALDTYIQDNSWGNNVFVLTEYGVSPTGRYYSDSVLAPAGEVVVGMEFGNTAITQAGELFVRIYTAKLNPDGFPDTASTLYTNATNPTFADVPAFIHCEPPAAMPQDLASTAKPAYKYVCTGAALFCYGTFNNGGRLALKLQGTKMIFDDTTDTWSLSTAAADTQWFLPKTWGQKTPEDFYRFTTNTTAGQNWVHTGTARGTPNQSVRNAHMFLYGNRLAIRLELDHYGF